MAALLTGRGHFLCLAHPFQTAQDPVVAAFAKERDDSRMAEPQNKTVSLGCGTLILIAIIVLIFGNSGSNKELDQRLDRIEQQLDRIEQKVDKLN